MSVKDHLTASLSREVVFYFLAGVVEILKVQKEEIFYFQAATFCITPEKDIKKGLRKRP